MIFLAFIHSRKERPVRCRLNIDATKHNPQHSGFKAANMFRNVLQRDDHTQTTDDSRNIRVTLVFLGALHIVW